MRLAVLLLLIASLASAFVVQADFLGVQETGDENLESLDVGISIDCDEKDLTVSVMGEDSEEPVAGASAFLFYTDYEYQLIATGTSDSEGIANIDVLGNRDYLTALFILRVDKSGYRSKEIEFAYEKCFEEPPAAPPPEPEEEPEEPEVSPVEPPVEPPPIEEVEPPVEVSPPVDEEAPAQAPEPAACPLGLALLSLLFIKMRY